MCLSVYGVRYLITCLEFCSSIWLFKKIYAKYLLAQHPVAKQGPSKGQNEESEEN